MPALVRAATLRALRDAAQFSIPEETLQATLAATPELIRGPERLAPLEAAIKATLKDRAPLPAAHRASAVPVLGNIAEAVVESLLADRGWQPVYGDDHGFSFGPGIDLIMLEPTLTRLVAIEVKSTIQPARWPRLARRRSQQLTPEWLNGPGNTGMVEWGVRSEDTYLMVVQMQLHSRTWRCCLAGDPISPRPVTAEEQLEDLDWLVPLPSGRHY